MATLSHDTTSLKSLSGIIKKLIPFQQMVVLTAMPRGGLQICQPPRLPSGLLKVYAEEDGSQDRLSWQSMLRKRPVQPADVSSRENFADSNYARELMTPLRLVHVVAFPLAAPVFTGYPGSIHLLRTKEQGPFTSSQISSVMAAIKNWDQKLAAERAPRRGASNDGALARAIAGRPTGLKIVDAKMRVLIGNDAWTNLDDHLKGQIIDYTKRRFQQLNNHGTVADRAHFPDKRSHVWVYRIVTFKRYPAVGEGPISFLCPQPHCTEWMDLKASDFAADPEMARLIPSLRFMRKSFRDAPTLVSIANTAGLSAFHFHRRFTELLGMTPKQFMADCQIHEAKTDLIGGKVELAEIARDCGFSHQSHFTSRFKQATGHTPTGWRRLARSVPRAGARVS